MKNPFPENMWPEDLIAIVHGEITLEEARYAAHAINQHEKLVKMLKKLEWCGDHDESAQFLESCPCCGQAPKWHASGCELDALLKET